MKVVKKTDDIYIISAGKTNFIFSFLTTVDGIVISIKEGKNLISYNRVYTLEQLINISLFFKSFVSLSEAAKGIKAQIISGSFNLNAKPKEIILSFSFLGRLFNLNIPLENDHNKPFNISEFCYEIEELNIKINKYEKTITFLTHQLVQMIHLVKNLTQEANQSKKVKEDIIVYIQEIIKETKNQINKEKEEKRKKQYQINVTKENCLEILQPKSSKTNQSEIHFDLSRLNLIQTITDHSSCVWSLCLLDDGRFASCSSDKTIKIFNPETYECELTLIGHTDSVVYITLLKSGILLSSSDDRTVRFWKVFKDNYISFETLNTEHTRGVTKVIELTNNRIASCSYDGSIKIWDNNPKKLCCIITLTDHVQNVKSIIELKNCKFIVSGGEDKKIRFWSNTNYKCEKIINNVYCRWNDSMIEVGDKLIVGGHELTIINLNTYEIEKKMKFDGVSDICSLLHCERGNVLCGCKIGEYWSLISVDVIQYQYLDIKRGVHSQYIRNLLKLKNKIIVSCSVDNTIKVWG